MTTRTRHQEDVEEAYRIQSQAAVRGGARATAVGTGLAVVAHQAWPVFRAQTLAFKGFLVSGFTIVGLVFGAENALLAHETKRRQEENAIRREARIDLGRRGLIGTETEIAKWRAAKEKT